MYFSSFALACTITSLFMPSFSSGFYVLTDDYSGDAFWGNFSAFTGPDPTNGYVQFMNYDDATLHNLIGSSSNFGQAAYLGVNYGTVHANATSTGRASMRISSTKRFNHGLFLLDLSHMPSSVCGSWPAFWLLGSGTWPEGGEIDIIEGVHTSDANQISAHTTHGCTISSTGFTGSAATMNHWECGPDDANTGCGILDSKQSKSFGSSLNNAGGGIYATEWTSEAISVWFFPRSNIPQDIQGAGPPMPASWGVPIARFAGPDCNIDDHFKEMQIIFDTTFCGDWAGKQWEQSGCQASTGVDTCQEYVGKHPEAFARSFWLVNSIKIYEQQ